jgi:hypothetical protein
MTEPTRTIPGRIVVSPDDPERRRSWPDPRVLDHVIWAARYSPESLDHNNLRLLATVAEAYRHIFSISQRAFLPTHAAIRAAAKNTTDPAVES